MKRIIAYLALACCTATAFGQAAENPYAEAGLPFLQNYGPLDYGIGPQNWDIVQDQRGILYFANNDGILEYDGVNWQVIGGDVLSARSLALGTDGVVYVGAYEELGYLAPDSIGDMQYISLLDQLPEAERAFGNVWSTVPMPDGIFFQTETHLFHRRLDGTMRTWTTDSSSGKAWAVNESLYLQQGDDLMRLESDSLHKVPNIALNERLRFLLPYREGSLFGYTSAGFFIYDGSAQKPFPTEADTYFAENEPLCATTLPDGTFIVGTGGGMVHLDADGHLLRILDRASGLRNDLVYTAYVDHSGGLWLGLDDGLSHIEWSAPLSIFGEENGLLGSVEQIARHDGRLYAVTRRGVFRLRPASPDDPKARFEQVEGIATAAWDLLSHGPRLLVGTSEGVYQIDGLQATQLATFDAVALHRMRRDTTLVMVGGFDQNQGVARLRYDPARRAWNPLKKVADLYEMIWQFAEDDAGDLWLALYPTGLARMRFPENAPDSVQIEQFGPEHGLPLSQFHFLQVEEGLFLSSWEGIFRFDPEQQRFLPDSTFGAVFAPGGMTMLAPANTVYGVWSSTGNEEDEADQLEITHFQAQPTGSYPPTTVSALRRLPPLIAWHFHEDTDAAGSILWIGASAGIYRYEASRADIREAARPLIRRFTIGDSLLYGGQRTASFAAPALPFSKAALRFAYALPAFDATDRTRYQVRLDGFDEDWTDWTDETRKDYTNLREGTYRFTVRAKNVYGQQSESEAFAFSILPPWYRTGWAYAVYGLFALGLFYAGARAWNWRLEQKNRQLEETVALRTQEVRQKNEENERLLLNILPGPIAERLKHSDEPIADAFADVTVLFADLVGFTTLSQQVSAADLVALLNDLFSEFDALAIEHGVEKIKTIGDAYMAVCGLPEERPDHAEAMAAMALDMMEALDGFNTSHGTSLQLRAGLNTGPAVAGVIGTHKFIYDLWGDAVNTAARMESHGVPNRVHVSAATHARLEEAFVLEARGPIEIKGKGRMQTYLLKAPKLQPAPAQVIA